MTNNLTIKKVSKDEFLNSKMVWNELLDISASNNLFLRWEWISSWWVTWSDKINESELLVIFVYSNDDLIGIAPFYKDVRRLFNILSINRIQFIGTSYQSVSTVRSEYLGLIYIPEYWDQFFNVLIKYLDKNVSYDELILKDIKSNDVFVDYLFKESAYRFRRVVGSDIGYVVNTKDSFNVYIENLSANTRLGLYNRRKRLSKHGDIKVEHYDLSHGIVMFDLLNKFHRIRWGADCFSGLSLSFHNAFLESLTPGCCFSILKIGNEIVSIQYNIVIGNTLYNIQSGYDETHYQGLSLGTLHIGYELEHCFNSDNIKFFDFLAGEGRATDYKKKYNGLVVEFQSVQFVKNKLLILLYSIKNNCFFRRIF